MPIAPPPAHTAPVSRVLDPAEWAEKLVGTSLEPFIDRLKPGVTDVVVVEVDGQVVACWAAMSMIHVEGLWVAEDFRGHAGVARSLISTMAEQLKAQGVPEVLTVALEPAVETLCEKVGGSLVPGHLWVIPLPGLEAR